MTSQSLIDSNVGALNEGAELLNMLDSEQYASGFKPAFQATIGGHYRHVIEHYRCLFSQIAQGVVCYDKRERDEQLESDIEYALRSIAEIVGQLESIDFELFNRSYHIVDLQSAGPLATTLQRELLFLQSHTVHHYAMIAGIARGLGKQPMRDFGIAIATIKHRNDMGDVAPTDEPSKTSESESTLDRSKSCAQ